MKATKGITFISLLLIATMAFTPLIVAFDDGSFGGFDAGAFSDGSFGGFDSGAFSDGSSGGFDAGAFSDGSFGGFDAGAFSGNTDEPTTFDGTDTTDPSVSFDDPGSFDDGFTGGNPMPPTPPGGDTGFPTEADAIWQNLPDVTIFQGSRDGTIIQTDVFSKCTDPDDELLYFEITSASSNYELFFVFEDIMLFDLDPAFIGTETVTVTCNGVPENFALQVIPGSAPRPAPITEEADRLSAFIGAIIIPDAYDAQAGDTVPVTISFKNNGDHELEDLEGAVTIQDLNVRASFGPLDLPIGKRVSRTVNVELPEDTEPGTYTARIEVYSGSVHRIKHRDVEVIV